MSTGRWPSFVIAISGTSGSGKTSLVQQVVQALGDATSFYADDYASLARQPPDLGRWLDDGADPGAFENPELREALATLRDGTPLSHPRRGEIQPARFIVMEEPFGRARPGVGELLDFVACIDIPLEIALARKLLRETGWVVEAAGPEATIDHLRGVLSGYLHGHVRDVYVEIQRRALQSCDLVLDGLSPLDHLADRVVAAVLSREKASNPGGPGER
jgi:uridine kinase